MTISAAEPKSIDLVPVTSPGLTEHFGMPLKPSVILLRWPVVIVCAYLLLYPQEDYLSGLLSHLIVILYISSNVGLYFKGEEKFATWSFYYPLIVADTIVLTISLLLNGYADNNFYITFFLLIIATCIIDDAKLRAVSSIAASALYAALVFLSAENVHPSVFLRVPFLFVISLFYGYFTQFIRTEKTLKAEAEKRSEVQKEIMDVLSHELRTPLNVIGGYAESLKNGTWGEVNGEQDKALRVVIGQSGNLLTLVESLIDLTRIDSGDFRTDRQNIALGEFLHEMKRSYSYELQKPVTLRWTIPPDLPDIRSDKVRLAVILQNLISNAVKFTQEGEIHISADSSRKTVDLRVADTGIGIPKNQLAQIFEKFYQVDRTSTRVFDGLGLGLYIVKVFTDLLGGKIEVKSEVNRGTTFTVSLPV
jgi:two-component system, sensor histidine kinase ChiS